MTTNDIQNVPASPTPEKNTNPLAELNAPALPAEAGGEPQTAPKRQYKWTDEEIADREMHLYFARALSGGNMELSEEIKRDRAEYLPLWGTKRS
jgi:hypothetical protein